MMHITDNKFQIPDYADKADIPALIAHNNAVTERLIGENQEKILSENYYPEYTSDEIDESTKFYIDIANMGEGEGIYKRRLRGADNTSWKDLVSGHELNLSSENYQADGIVSNGTPLTIPLDDYLCFNQSGSFTIAFSAKVPATTETNDLITIGGTRKLVIQQRGAYGIRLITFDDTNAMHVYPSEGYITPNSYDEYHHYVITCSTGLGNVRWYQDGVLVSGATSSITNNDSFIKVDGGQKITLLSGENDNAGIQYIKILNKYLALGPANRIYIKHSVIDYANDKTQYDNKFRELDKPVYTVAETRTSLTSGEKLSTAFGKIKKWFADLKPIAFSGSYGDLEDVPYASCSTPATTAIKEVSINNFKLITGAVVRIRFIYRNQTGQINAKLNVNNTGAKDIVLFVRGDYADVLSDTTWSEGETVEFIYNGVSWVAISSNAGFVQPSYNDLSTVALTNDYNDLINKPTIPSAVTVDSALSSTSENPVQNKAVQSAIEGLNNGKLSHTVIDNVTDFNDIITTGIYHIHDTTGANRPSQHWGTLFVDGSSASVIQIYIPDAVAEIYRRHKSGGQWTKWVQLADKNANMADKLAELAEIHNAPIVIDTSTTIVAGAYSNYTSPYTDDDGNAMPVIIYAPNATEIACRSCNDNGHILTVIAPKLKIIRDQAFWGCHHMKFMYIPSTCTTIDGGHAFSYCEDLTTLYIDKTENSISGSPWQSYGGNIKNIYWLGGNA